VKITEAFQILNSAPATAPAYRVRLACGFTPLHLGKFLGAHLQRRLTDRRVSVVSGLYGDLPGTIEGLARDAAVHALAVVPEWSDLDARLGYRSAGGWGPRAIADILRAVDAALGRIGDALERVPAEIPVALALPTLPLPPLFHTPGCQAGEAEMTLEHSAAKFGLSAARRRGCRVLSAGWLAAVSPHEIRFDFKSDLLTGLPYTLPHASAIASALADLLVPSPPKKGLITDLDDTLWSGILGEVGPENVSWDLGNHHHVHGLYQTLLSAFAEEGALIAVSSKNDPALVEQVFRRGDLLLRAGQVFPVEVNWNAKSASVARILRAWNLAADSVVFVDDSPMELAEVAAAHPGIEVVPFPQGDYAAAYKMLRRLREFFAKSVISVEDSIRLESVRQGAVFQESGTNGQPAAEAFLEAAEATITFDFDASARDERLLELVNKTNQFNLNGIRYTPADWRLRLALPNSVLVSVGYQDKFGPLGKIAVILGRVEDGNASIDTWVMSCRAFARRIEYCCVKTIFEHYGLKRIDLNFIATPRNVPLQDFLTTATGNRPTGPVSVTRELFEEKCPPLYQSICEAQPTQAHGSD
jgi:FkbH-like protein